jgi:hypothetical protein
VPPASELGGEEDVPKRRWTSRPKLKSLNDIEQKYHSMGHRQQRESSTSKDHPNAVTDASTFV